MKMEKFVSRLSFFTRPAGLPSKGANRLDQFTCPYLFAGFPCAQDQVILPEPGFAAAVFRL